MQWFRFYHDAINDPKILKLSDKLHRIWIQILCAASMNDGKLPPHDDLALVVRMKPQKLTEALENLGKAGLIDDDGTNLSPHNWDLWQYKSDNSTARVKRFRNGKRNVSVTPPETDTDTDKSNNRNLTSLTGRDKRAKRACRLPADAVPSDRNIADAQMVGLTPAETDQQWQRMRDWSASSPKGACLNWDARWRNWIGTFLTSRTTTNGHTAFPETEGQRDRRKHREVIDALRRSVEDDLRETGSDPDLGLLPIKPSWQ